MDLFKVYPLYNVTPVSAKGAYVWDDKGTKHYKRTNKRLYQCIKK